MTKRPTLSNLQGQLASKRGEDAPPAEAEPKAKRPRRKIATGETKVIYLRINVAGWRELRKLAAAKDSSVQNLMIDAANNLLRENNRPAVAENPLI
jgi:hypothetical protein